MSASRTPLLAANWKCNQLWTDCERFTEQLQAELPQFFAPNAEPGLDLVVCPPFTYLPLLGTLLENAAVYLGGQDVSRFDGGAYTGDVSAAMLSDLECDYAIVGHSERRGVFGDTDEIVALKLRRAREAELVPILCVGEALAVRDAGRAVEFTLGQLDAAFEELRHCMADALVIAYEPIWAIGTGRNAEPGDAQQMAAAIRGWLANKLGAVADQVPILYGGSVKPDNAAAYFELSDVDGALVGGASLKASSFAALARLLV